MKTIKDTILSMLENGEVRRNELFMLSMLHEGEYKSSEIHKTIEILKEEGLISERIAFVSDLEYKTAFYYLNK